MQPTEPPLTLPQLAKLSGVEYRTLHTWLARGLLRASHSVSPGAGTANLFTRHDAVQAIVLADLRRAGLGLELLTRVADPLREHIRVRESDGVVLISDEVTHVESTTELREALRAGAAVAYDLGEARRSLEIGELREAA